MKRSRPANEVEDLHQLRRHLMLGPKFGESIDIPDWLPASFSAYRQSVLDADYPCYLGTMAEARGEMIYSYVDGPQHVHHVAETLTAFTDVSEAHVENRHALALFFRPEPDEQTHEYYERAFWTHLSYLREHDPAPWPADIPEDPEHHLWEFCFNGVPMFIFSASPSYKKRRSRNLGPSLILLFQPRSVFEGIEGDTRSGRATRSRIRSALERWNLMKPHPSLNAYGDPTNREWRQYFLPDTNDDVKGTCPLHALLRRGPRP
ncbi:MAG: YqcI/YcgG family protein [Planctomycetes bacterium]|nr:YqcI/YcgG family protein [Planctomycetota bacterium]NOG53471.1 YqcI/YcgG family protein [Planctomycetota bacterium]